MEYKLLLAEVKFPDDLSGKALVLLYACARKKLEYALKALRG